MSSIIDSFAQGRALGRDIGSGFAARGLRRRTEDAERQLLAGELTPEQFETHIRDAQGQGFFRRHDTDAVAEQLRQRGLGTLDLRDNRAAAGYIVAGDHEKAVDRIGNVVARAGDTAGALNVRNVRTNIEAGRAVTDVGSQQNYAPALDIQRREMLGQGEIARAQQLGGEATAEMNRVGAYLANKAQSDYNRGDKGAAAAHMQQLAALRGINMEFGLTPEGGLGARMPDGTTVVFDEDELMSALHDFGAGHDDVLERGLQVRQGQQAAEAEWNARVREKIFDAGTELITDFKLPEALARSLATATAELSADGVRQLGTDSETGVVMMNVRGRVIHAIPVRPDPDPDDPHGAKALPGYIYRDAATGEAVNINQIPESVQRNVGALAQATNEATQLIGEAEVERAFTTLGTQLALLDQHGWNARGLPGDSPVMRAHMQNQNADAEQGLSQFQSIVLNDPNLEGTGDNPLSTAAGPYQFVHDTLREYILKAMPDSEIAKTLRTLPEDSREEAEFLSRIQTSRDEDGSFLYQDVLDAAFRAFTTDNMRALARAGFAPVPLNLYAAHHFGATGGVAFLRAPLNKSMREVYPPRTEAERRAGKSRVLQQNPKYADMTVGQVLQDWNRRAPELFAGIDLDAELAAVAERTAAAPADARADAPAERAAVSPDVEQLVALRDSLQKSIRARTQALQSQPVRETSPPPRDPTGALALPRAMGISRLLEADPIVAEQRATLAELNEAIARAERAARATERSQADAQAQAAIQAARAGLPPRGAQ